MIESNNPKAFTLHALAAAVEATVDGDGETLITGVAPIESAGSGDISFVANAKYTRHIATTGASALILAPGVPCQHRPVIRHANPYLAYAHIVDMLYADAVPMAPGIDASAQVHESATVDATACVGPLCDVAAGAAIGASTRLLSSVFVGRDVRIGANCLFYPGVRIMHGCRIGNNVILHAGAVIGSDGFGFAPSPTGLKKIKQIGWVEVSDDVEIGANTTVDRGAIGPTKVGRRTKIDNLVQIGHNVVIGDDCIIVSQVGISGSTKVGNRVVLAGQVGVVGHIEIGNDVQIGAQSGVAKSVPAGTKVFGSPARGLIETNRIQASLTRLPELLKRVRQLEKKLDTSSGD
ncbi:MAG: UDP-3-O-(3-hydroxymyristoyl)glucosamine N-acyltransferase [candidate division Zixibacteria bacterium]|nr:UDP-3-O-(3-hydroxymyristoyl)glucosamine N-acyltransferase [candidate division Zixibacteria bacterium]